VPELTKILGAGRHLLGLIDTILESTERDAAKSDP
jgi:hypothetical protein